MRLDEVTAEIRPRSDWEAVDLGLAMVRRNFWRCWLMWWLSMLPLTLLVVVVGWDHPLLWLPVFWWWQPAGSRLVLFEISRRLFGENPSWADALREIPKAWTRRFFHRFFMARISLWQPVTLAVEDLEMMTGEAYKKRCNQVTRRGEGAITWLYLMAIPAAFWLGFAILFIVIQLIPEGQDGSWRLSLESWSPQQPLNYPMLVVRMVVLCIMVAMSLVNVFITGAGFGIYVNNRTWIEGWDVELAFKRMSHRLAKVVIWFALATLTWAPCGANAAMKSAPAEVIRKVKADPAFVVHKVTERVPKQSSASSSHSWLERFFDWLFGLGKGGSGSLAGMDAMAMMMWVFVISVAAIVIGLLLWMIWANRNYLRLGRLALEKKPAPVARVVMGMEVSPESLPADIPETAWDLWRQGKHHDALGLLYRGAISRVMELHHVEILESDTEGDCLTRVESVGLPAHPIYFRGITAVWTSLAYARVSPDEAAVERLCREWPFVERSKP